MAGGGGAWKVAYADFITAMMALFMVLWILGSEEELLEQLQEYFRNPPSPFDSQSGKFPVDIGEFSGHSAVDDKELYYDSKDASVLQGVMDEFYKVLDVSISSEEAPPVEITITSDGLRLVMFDREGTRLFNDSKAELSEWGQFLTQNLAWLLSRYPFDVVIESHSGELDELQAKEFTDQYGAWELTSDRSNEIRRSLQFYANGDLDIKRVSGYGKTKPLEGGTGRGRTNQRVHLALSLTKGKEIDLSHRDFESSTVKIAKVNDEDEE